MDQHVGEALVSVQHYTAEGVYDKVTKMVVVGGLRCPADGVSTCEDAASTIIWGTIDTSCDVRFRECAKSVLA